MTFLQPLLLMALPIAALPVIIHLIHLLRRRQVKWAAMIFLRAAQQMQKGLSRLRQILILALRVLAVAAIILVAGRPLAGGWLGLTGGAPDTVLVLLDRSASMEQKDLATGVSKRMAGLRNLAKAIDDTTRGHSHVVLIDSALCKPLALDRADALLDVPQTEATDTAADIPALMQAALDYITTNKTGRTDVWLLSDMQQSNWAPSDGRWQSLRSAFALLQGVRFHLLTYPEPANGDLAVTVDHVARREMDDKAELLLDLRVTRRLKAGERPQPVEVPLRFEVNGITTTAKVTVDGGQAALDGYAIPIDTSTKRGWGRVELPADACPQDNVFYFAFDQPPPLRSVIVSDDPAEAGPLSAALSAAEDPARKYTATVLGSGHAAEIPWADTALIVWQAPLPKADSAIARELRQHVAAGRSILFMPPQTPDGAELFGMHWENWKTASPAKPASIEWWRNDSDLLANTRDGAALPVGTMEITRYCPVGGDGVPLARMADNGGVLLARNAEGDRAGGGVYFLGTLPDSGSSSLARDGVVMFAMLHRALDQGAATLGKAQQGYAAANALGPDPSLWKPVEQGTPLIEMPLHAGVVASGDRLIALNRPPGEDAVPVVSDAGIRDLFSGLDYRVLTGTLEDKRSLTNEVWRTFLICMALAILGEALLCMPPRKTAAPAPPQWAGKETA
ncbi:MAG TPA: BatA domain-containing protein [Chthoniobacteraceae bacterium]|jgi:hypothetical protein|nr:BatA domain-containing protein [Chthoniobacteraceae bacterium]